MTSVLLIYPYFKPTHDRSVFRFPPLGISYLAASLQKAEHQVSVLDCTFIQREEALSQALAARAEVVGIYCMVTMMEDCLWFASELHNQCKLLLTGGPLPTCDPDPFLDYFDIVVRGEGEQAVVEIIYAFEHSAGFGNISGIAYRNRKADADGEEEQDIFTPERKFEPILDRLPFPARHLLPNSDYIRYGKKKYGYSITTVMSTRGCPFRCEFCSNVVFGGTYRERSPNNVVDEIEEALALGYERISFADDVFTLKRSRVIGICEEIRERGLRFKWECLGRVDAMDYSLASEMKKAGCTRIYFGIESGNDEILKLMHKKITLEQARAAVEVAHEAGLETGAFFILFYPGDTQETVLQTIHFAASLPLDYLGLTLPYPLPGTELYGRIKERITREWRPGESVFASHRITFQSGFSTAKMWFGIFKGQTQFRLKCLFGDRGLVLKSYEWATDMFFKLLK